MTHRTLFGCAIGVSIQRFAQNFSRSHPRFKSRARYDSLSFKQYGNSFNLRLASKKNRGTLTLAKLGQVKMVMHREIKGLPKTAIVKRNRTGKWFVSISVEVPEVDVSQKRLSVLDTAVGIDVGLNTFAYLSTGEEIGNPRFFREEEAALARASRKLSKAPKGSKQADQPLRVACCGGAHGACDDQKSQTG